jgi:hypothetical protein
MAYMLTWLNSAGMPCLSGSALALVTGCSFGILAVAACLQSLTGCVDLEELDISPLSHACSPSQAAGP